MSVAQSIVKPIGNTDFVHSVTDRSVEDIIGDSPTAMVYGFQHCKYIQVTDALEGHKDVSRIYDCSLGNDYDPVDNPKQKRLNGESIHKIDSGVQSLERNGKQFETQDCNRKCKAGLVNHVLENFRSSKLGDKNISPIIFCIDFENEEGGNPYPLSSENLLSKTKKIHISACMTLEMNRVVTHSELRRAHKLCNDPKVDSEVRAIAKKTFKFVKVKESREEVIIDKGQPTVDKEIRVQFDLTEVAAPWEESDFDSELAEREKYSATQVKQPKDADWRAELNGAV